VAHKRETAQPLFVDKAQAWWYLSAAAAFSAFFTAFYLVASFWPTADLAIWIITGFGMVCVLAVNLMLIRMARGLPFRRKWIAQVRRQQRFSTNGGLDGSPDDPWLKSLAVEVGCRHPGRTAPRFVCGVRLF
jgi:hypothetical protein